MNMTNQLVITFFIYFIGMFLIGIYAYLKTKNSEDYFLGGRSLGPWTTALSAGASDMSGWLLLGLPGYVLISGLDGIWLTGGLLIGGWCNWMFLAKPLRVYSEVLDNSLTIPDFLSNRVKDNKKIIQLISSILILVFFLFYTSAGLVAGGKLFSAVFDFDYKIAVTIGTISVVSYTLFGGFMAVCWTDMIQGLMMMAALLIVPIFALNSIPNNFQDVIPLTNEANPYFLNLFVDSKGEKLSFLSIISLAAWGLGYFGQPHILARFAAIKNYRELKISRHIAVTWTFLCMVGAVAVGWCGMLYVNQHGLPLIDPEQIFIQLVSVLFHPLMAGVLLAAILAAIMSTADSQLLICSTTIAEDIYARFIRPEATATELLHLGRISVAVISIIATVLAYNPNSTVLGLVSYAWAGLGASFGPALLMSLYWKRINYPGTLAGIVAGGATTIAWKYSWEHFPELLPDYFGMVYEIIPGFIISLVSIIIVSLITRHPEKDIIDKFMEVKEKLK
jgi:sodium/proline symporter